jgi:hypothetical protein
METVVYFLGNEILFPAGGVHAAVRERGYVWVKDVAEPNILCLCHFSNL